MTKLAHSTKQNNPCSAVVPEPWSTIIDARCAADAFYFETHPEITEFRRPADPGEFWPAQAPDGALVRVVQLWPGARVRQVVE